MPALTSYSFGAQDFSSSGAMSADIMSLPQWHQGLVQHTRWVVQGATSPASGGSSSSPPPPEQQQQQQLLTTLNGHPHDHDLLALAPLPCSLSHLSVSNSTPPPASSPISIKVKAEPQSPPRDLSASGGHQHNSNGSTGSGSSSSSTSSNNSVSGIVAAAIRSANTVTQLNNDSILSSGAPGGAGGGGGGGGTNGSVEQATNLSVLSHSQQHLVMPNSRPSSTGHITPTSGMSPHSNSNLISEISLAIFEFN